MSLSPVPSTVAAFRALHESGCFVLPNPWDVGTALYLRHLGFKALATTSAGAAFSRGLPDDVSAIPLDVMLTHIREIVAETGLPVNADFQAGYADEPAGVATNVTLCVHTGVAGLSIEDATGDSAAPLYERELAVERGIDGLRHDVRRAPGPIAGDILRRRALDDRRVAHAIDP